MFRFLRKVRFIKIKSGRSFATETNIISSKAAELNIYQESIHDYLWRNLEKKSEKTAIVCSETQKSYTFYQLYTKSLSVTGFLRDSLKLKLQQAVGIVLYNLPEYPIVLLGAAQAGLKITTCNPNYTSDEIRRQLLNSEVELVFTSRTLVKLVQNAIKGIPKKIQIIEIVDENVGNRDEGVISFDEITSRERGSPVDVNTEDILFLPYSSGTTGLPKGVKLSHFNIVSNLKQRTSPEFTLSSEFEQEVLPAFLPFFHIYGLVIVLLDSISLGNKLVSIPKFSSDVFIRLLREHKPSIIFGVPSTILLIINNAHIRTDDLSSIKYLVSGAAPLGIADVERFRTKTQDKVQLLQAYGMTETSPLTLHQTTKMDNGVKIGGAGLLIPNTYAKFISTEGSLETNLGPNQTGELLIKGPQVMMGYYNNPEATREVLTEDGWLRTGDIGYYDDDHHFYITDRLKELIKVKGFQVAPAELEEILRDHPHIEDAAVVGVPHPVQGEAPKAFVVPKVGVSLKADHVAEYVASKVAKYKHLVGGVAFISAIPKNPSGKILRRNLRDL